MISAYTSDSDYNILLSHHILVVDTLAKVQVYLIHEKWLQQTSNKKSLTKNINNFSLCLQSIQSMMIDVAVCTFLLKCFFFFFHIHIYYSSNFATKKIIIDKIVHRRNISKKCKFYFYFFYNLKFLELYKTCFDK